MRNRPQIRRCALGPGDLTPEDQAEIDRFAAFLSDLDPDRAAAYARHYPEEAR